MARMVQPPPDFLFSALLKSSALAAGPFIPSGSRPESRQQIRALQVDS